MRKLIFSVLAMLFVAQLTFAQDIVYSFMPQPKNVSGKEVEARKSPMMSSSLRDGNDYAKIIYSQPHLRGRQMVGGNAAPYGKVWRLGANEATEIFLNDDLEIDGKVLNEGAYAIFAIPNEKEWTIIFSNQLGQWGAYNYDESHDELRVTVPVQESKEKFEAFTIWFSDNEGDSNRAMLNMAWDTAMVSAPVRFD